jgi:hypothetical protein
MTGDTGLRRRSLTMILCEEYGVNESPLGGPVSRFPYARLYSEDNPERTAINWCR